MADSLPIPPWLGRVPDPNSFLQAYSTAANIAQQNAGLAQRARIAEIEQNLRAQEFTNNQELQQQQMAMQKAYHDAELGLKAEAAAHQYQSMRDYQDALESGMDPLQAILKFGPGMGHQASAEAAAMRASQLNMQNAQPWQIHSVPLQTGGPDYSDYASTGYTPQEFQDDISAGIIKAPETVNFMQRGNEAPRFIPKTAIFGPEGEDFAPIKMTPLPGGGTFVQSLGASGGHVVKGEATMSPASAWKGLIDISAGKVDTNMIPPEVVNEMKDEFLDVLKRNKKTSESPTAKALRESKYKPGQQIPGAPAGYVEGAIVTDKKTGELKRIVNGIPIKIQASPPQPAAPVNE